jgi:valyl-tRNA synthetase
MEVYLPLAGLVDVAVERQRLEKKRGEIEKGLSAVERKLASADFAERAPREVVEGERERRTRLAADLAAVSRNLESLTE